MSGDVSKDLEELLAYIEKAVKSGRFDDQDAGIAWALELLRSDEQSFAPPMQKRQGGQWKGQVTISPDFDELPDDIAESFGAQ